MKSMSLLFLAAAGLAFYLAGAGLEASGRNVLVSSSVSPETWRRACAYMGPRGMWKVEVDAQEACQASPESASDSLVRQARLAP
ncbi:MAG: hypothetical protein K2Y29_04640 [Beijerinckiaceae bacterium]|nr:hypothetical protein [Beijerinckiaceae bacterium]